MSEEIKNLIKLLIQDWLESDLPQIIHRNINLEKYLEQKVPKIIAITGFRRAGKTYLVYQLLNELLRRKSKNEVLYFNFEDERIPLKTEVLTELLPTIKEMSQKPIQYLFLDEIQNIPNWSKWVRRIYDREKNLKIIITGSSSKMSSREIPTELRGRCLQVEVLPLSFKEFLRFKNAAFDLNTVPFSEKSKIQLNRLFKEYLVYGGMPEIVLSEPAKKMEILQQYYQTVVRRDLIERYNIKNEEGLKALMLLLLNSTSYSQTKLYNTLKSLSYKIGKTTLSQYIAYIESSYFMQSRPIFSPKIKDQLLYPRKVYFVDNGFISALSTKFSHNFGRLYENLVNRELERMKNVNTEIFYWKDDLGREVDFVVKEGFRVSQVIQVCSDILDFDTKKREIRSLIKAGKELKCNSLSIYNQNVEKEEKADHKKIKFLPLWKRLLEDHL